MRKADYIVACLLEASPKGTTLRFGPGDDPYGEEFFSLGDALEGQDEAEMINRGYTFMVQKNPGDIGVYGAKPQISTLEKGIQLVAQTFGISPETKVNFSPASGAPGKPIPLKDVLRERPMRGKSGEMAPERENPVKAAGVAAQPADVEEPEMEQPDIEREKYVHKWQGQQPVAQNVPLDFGMEVDSTYRQVGVLVSHIIPSGPAALGGLEAGDRIVRLHFETEDGSWGPYKITTLPVFKFLRSFMQPGYTVGMDVIRGGNQISLSVRPKYAKTASQSGPEMEVGTAEANEFNRAWSGMEQDRNNLPSLTVRELAQAYRIEPQQVVFILNKLGARTRDYIPTEQQPNEREPARVTGNQPANPSALT